MKPTSWGPEGRRMSNAEMMFLREIEADGTEFVRPGEIPGWMRSVHIDPDNGAAYTFDGILIDRDGASLSLWQVAPGVKKCAR